MKIKKSLVEQIIKEEAIKIKKLIVLKEEKENILKQLNELYEENLSEETLDEWNPFAKADPAAVAVQAQPLIDALKSQTAKSFFTQLLKVDPSSVVNLIKIFKERVASSQAKLAKLQEAMQVSFERALAYMKAVAAAPITTNLQWDETKQKYTDLAPALGNAAGAVGGYSQTKITPPQANPTPPQA